MDATGVEYNVKLQRIVREVRRDVDAVKIPLIKRYAKEYVWDSAEPGASPAVVVMDGWVDALAVAMARLVKRWSSPKVQAQGRRIAESFVQTALKKSERDLKRTTGIDAFSHSPGMREYLKASAYSNATLIKSIPARYLEEVGIQVAENMRAGMRPSYIVEALQKNYGVSERRAKFIARDQTGKIQGDLSEKQQRGAGFEYFQWIDSDDSRVRHWHSEIANRITAYGKGVYRWDDLPLSETGQPIKPGQDYNCRCIAKPVSARKVAENQRQGLTNKEVKR